MKTIKLLPCPFCGSDNLEPIRRVDGNHADVVYAMVLCHGCLAEGPLALDHEHAAKLWNRRAHSPVVRELVEAALNVSRRHDDRLAWARLNRAIAAVEREEKA